jgi:zinc/manganese transport system substrate-binding protein
MNALLRVAIAVSIGFCALAHADGARSQISVVAAENFYANVAQQVGGNRIIAHSILNNPEQDPHLFETTPAIVRQIAAAQVVVCNGAGYDTWMTSLLNVTPKPERKVIVAADLLQRRSGDNPHLWYDPPTMPAVATAIAAALSTIDPANKGAYDARLKTFIASLQPLNEKIASIRKRFAGTVVTASEPVFGYMAAALGLDMLNKHFQLAVMNNTEPSARDVAKFEQDLRMHKVRVMFYNKQASDRIVQHLVDLSRAAKIPVVGVTETSPPGMSYQDWMGAELAETQRALSGGMP